MADEQDCQDKSQNISQDKSQNISQNKSQNKSRDRSYVGATPYDDVFRTLMTECSPLVLPIINEVFGESYTGDEKIEFGHNEYYLHQQDGREQKIITDSNFAVISNGERVTYEMECQSTIDSTIFIRMIEYIMQVALSEAVIGEDEIVLIPSKAMLLFLRSNSNTSKKMRVRVALSEQPGLGSILCMKINDYNIDEIFEKKLYFLIPFYIFNYESRFKDIESDEDKKKQLEIEYSSIAARIEKAEQDGEITTFMKNTIAEMSIAVHLINAYSTTMKPSLTVFNPNGAESKFHSFG